MCLQLTHWSCSIDANAVVRCQKALTHKTRGRFRTPYRFVDVPYNGFLTPDEKYDFSLTFDTYTPEFKRLSKGVIHSYPYGYSAYPCYRKYRKGRLKSYEHYSFDAYALSVVAYSNNYSQINQMVSMSMYIPDRDLTNKRKERVKFLDNLIRSKTKGRNDRLLASDLIPDDVKESIRFAMQYDWEDLVNG